MSMNTLRCLLLLAVIPCQAAITVVAEPDPAGVTSGTATSSSVDTTGATKLVGACVTYNESAAASTFTDSKSNTWTARNNYGATTANVAFFDVVGTPTVGSGHTFSCQSAGNANATVFAIALGGASTAAVDQQNGTDNFGSATIQPGSVTPTENNEIVLSFVGEYNANLGMYSIDGGFTISKVYMSATVMGGALAYLIQTTAAAANPTWTRDVESKAAANATYKVAAAGYVSNVSVIVVGP